jgi:hypothetical protein
MPSSITGVYGPQLDADKHQFLLEMRNLQNQVLPQWCMLGDFNVIFRADQKNNGQVNTRLMNSFRTTLDNLELKELKPHGRKFTWSNETDNPTFTKIDHIFVTKDWELARPNSFLQALSTSASDHYPMLLMRSPDQHYRKFRFETFWIKLPRFRELVQSSWDKPITSTDKVCLLHIKLSRLAKALKKWSI